MSIEGQVKTSQGDTVKWDNTIGCGRVQQSVKFVFEYIFIPLIYF